MARLKIRSIDSLKDNLAAFAPALPGQTDALDPHSGICALAHVINVGALMWISGADWIDHPSSGRRYRRTAQATTSRSIQIVVTTPTLIISPLT